MGAKDVASAHFELLLAVSEEGSLDRQRLKNERKQQSLVKMLPTDKQPIILRRANGEFQPHETLRDVAILPGSFNPLHHGHQQLKAAAELILGKRVVYEVSIQNAEKGRAKHSDLMVRLTQFRNDEIAITQASLFADKAGLFPGCDFVVGYDTAVRILTPGFYNNDVAVMHSSLREMLRRRHRFLVGGRLHRDKDDAMSFLCLDDLLVPDEFRALFLQIPESAFRADVSSRELRS